MLISEQLVQLVASFRMRQATHNAVIISGTVIAPGMLLKLEYLFPTELESLGSGA